MNNLYKTHNFRNDIFQYADKNSKHISNFKRKLKNKDYSISEYSCTICNTSDFTTVAEADEGFKWGICKSCGLLQIFHRLGKNNINEFYTSGEYQAICMGNLDDKTHFALEYEIMSLYFIDILNNLDLEANETNILEIGCGSGGILKAFKEWGANSVKGYDIDSQKINYGKSFVEEIEFADALELDNKIFSQYNIILLSNILEHLNDPTIFLNNLSKRLEINNNYIIIDIPNLEYMYSYSDISLQKFFHIGHLWYFNPITIEKLINKVGFRIKQIIIKGAAFSIVCKKDSNSEIINTNNSYWNTISSIQYTNFLNDKNNILNIAQEKYAKVSQKYL
ncbi:bifunctional 2-polyprenyl-6-hydroxyphenol methylase/3-demethylubiquinol 3-O-methyltransferase UbiG [Arcobacter sp. F2176]|uniref:class I SAM-dependent methyltransferase n=1 Tax=Arcobacter TaxID=28196 RepID=UPI00100AC79F|nr:class I SAM-dependent methyltransferase [Arcobacter sp. F2176]RXJ82205.1 hypothetical protein CRU95_01745 [Arcobacter sp. F2176]